MQIQTPWNRAQRVQQHSGTGLAPGVNAVVDFYFILTASCNLSATSVPLSGACLFAIVLQPHCCICLQTVWQPTSLFHAGYWFHKKTQEFQYVTFFDRVPRFYELLSERRAAPLNLHISGFQLPPSRRRIPLGFYATRSIIIFVCFPKTKITCLSWLKLKTAAWFHSYIAYECCCRWVYFVII